MWILAEESWIYHGIRQAFRKGAVWYELHCYIGISAHLYYHKGLAAHTVYTCYDVMDKQPMIPLAFAEFI